MALVYLVSTRCSDIVTELLLIAQKLSLDRLCLFFSHLRPMSLSKHLAESVSLFTMITTSHTHSNGSCTQSNNDPSEMNSVRNTSALLPQPLSSLAPNTQCSLSIARVGKVVHTISSGTAASVTVRLLTKSSSVNQLRKDEKLEQTRGKKRLIGRQPDPQCKAKRRASRSTAITVRKCENCVDGTCPHCSQRYSTLVN